MSDDAMGQAHVWIENCTRDKQATQDYYTGHFGWGTQTMEMGGDYPAYTMLSENGNSFGGLVALEGEMAEGMPEGWFLYFYSDDVDACARQCEALGGRIQHPPFDIEGIGRTALLADPHGNLFYAFKPASQGGEGEMGNPVSWLEIVTSDAAATKAFYTSLFGWGTDSFPMGEFGDYQMMTVNGKAFCGVDDFSNTGGSGWGIVFKTDAPDALAEDCRRRGGSVVVEPHDIPGVGRNVMLADPRGVRYQAIRSLH